MPSFARSLPAKRLTVAKNNFAVTTILFFPCAIFESVVLNHSKTFNLHIQKAEKVGINVFVTAEETSSKVNTHSVNVKQIARL